MATPTTGRAPRNNYFSVLPFKIINSFSGQEETFYAEDWREGWKREGKLIGDEKPVIRMVNPEDLSEFRLLRPYSMYKDNTTPTINEETQRLGIFMCPPLLGHGNGNTRITTPEGEIMEPVRLVEIFKRAFGPPNTASNKPQGWTLPRP